MELPSCCLSSNALSPLLFFLPCSSSLSCLRWCSLAWPYRVLTLPFCKQVKLTNPSGNREIYSCWTIFLVCLWVHLTPTLWRWDREPGQGKHLQEGKRKTFPDGGSQLVKTHWNLMSRLSWAAQRPEAWPETDLSDVKSARSRNKIFLVLKKTRQTLGVLNWQKPLRCLMRWFMCSCVLPRAPAASPLSHLALCELVEGAKPLKNCSSSLARSFSADGARCVGFWDSAEAAGTGEQAGPCDWNGSGSWVTLLLVAAHGWIGLGTFILWAPSLFVAVMWLSPNFQFWC